VYPFIILQTQNGVTKDHFADSTQTKLPLSQLKPGA